MDFQRAINGQVVVVILGVSNLIKEMLFACVVIDEKRGV
jgi:hypothetical protein